MGSTAVHIVAPPLMPSDDSSSSSFTTTTNSAAELLAAARTAPMWHRNLVSGSRSSTSVRPQRASNPSTTATTAIVAPTTSSIVPATKEHIVIQREQRYGPSIVRDQFFLGDNLKVLSDPSNGIMADAVITSPPYLLGHNPYHRAKGARDADFYSGGYTDGHAFWAKQPVDQYLNNMVTLFRLFEKTVREDGPVIINLSYGIENPSLPQRVIIAIEDNTDYMLADTMAWNKLRTMPLQASPCNLTRIVEWVYIFCRKPYHKKFRTNKRVTKENWKQKFYEYVPNYIEAANTYDGPKCNLVAHFSTGFVDQLLSIYVPEESVVLDPFMGSGTTAVSCVRNNRHFIGIDVDPSLVEIAQQRLMKEKSRHHVSAESMGSVQSTNQQQRRSNTSQRRRRQMQQQQAEPENDDHEDSADFTDSYQQYPSYENLDQAEYHLESWRRKISPTKDQYL